MATSITGLEYDESSFIIIIHTDSTSGSGTGFGSCGFSLSGVSPYDPPPTIMEASASGSDVTIWLENALRGTSVTISFDGTESFTFDDGDLASFSDYSIDDVPAPETLADLTTALRIGLQVRINAKTPSNSVGHGNTTQNIYSTADHSANGGAGSYARNAILFAHDLNLTAVTGYLPSATTATLITNNFALAVGHTSNFVIGNTIRFIKADGTPVDRTVISNWGVPGYDICVYKLSIPSGHTNSMEGTGITPLKVFPKNWHSYLNFSALPPLFCIPDQVQRLNVGAMHYSTADDPKVAFRQASGSAGDWFITMSEGISSSPIIGILNSEAIIAGLVQTGLHVGSSPDFVEVSGSLPNDVGILADAINLSMKLAGGDNTDVLSVVDLYGFNPSPGGGSGSPLSTTIKVRASGGDYTSLAACFDSINNQVYGDGNDPVTLDILLGPGNRGDFGGNYLLPDLAPHGKFTINIMPDTDAVHSGVASDSNACITGTGANNLGVGSDSTIGVLTIRGVQFGTSTTAGRTNLAISDGAVTVDGCIFPCQTNLGSGTYTLLSAVGGSTTAGIVTFQNNVVYSSVSQTGSLRGILATATTSKNLKVNCFHNSVDCSNLTIGIVRNYLGTLNLNMAFNVSIGSTTGKVGFGSVTTSGTLNLDAASDYNISSDSSANSVNNGAHGQTAVLNTEFTSSTNLKPVSNSVLLNVATMSPSPMDIIGTPRPQPLNSSGTIIYTVDAGAFELSRFPFPVDCATNTTGTTITIALPKIGCTPSGAANNGGFTLAGASATVASWAISGSTLTLTLNGVIFSTDSPLLSYDGTAAIEDAEGNSLLTAADITVVNNATTPGYATALSAYYSEDEVSILYKIHIETDGYGYTNGVYFGPYSFEISGATETPDINSQESADGSNIVMYLAGPLRGSSARISGADFGGYFNIGTFDLAIDDVPDE